MTDTPAALRDGLLDETAAKLLDLTARRDLDPSGPPGPRTLTPAVRPRPSDRPCTDNRTLAELTDLLKRRRSVRDFADRPVDADTVLGLCAEGDAARTRLVGAAPETAPPHWLIIARNVTGLAIGLHRWTRTDGLVRIGALPPPARWHAVLQNDVTTAPCLIQPVWPLDEVLADDGPDGYLNLLLATGAMLHTAWIAALGEGLAGCLVRDIPPARLAEPRTPACAPADAGTAALALALGHPQESR
jgi:hypothetical protein